MAAIGPGRILRQVPLHLDRPLIFVGIKLQAGYRIDILAERKVVIEVKSVEALNDVHLAQILTYMKLGDYKLGLLINFNVSLLKDGIKRVVNRI